MQEKTAREVRFWAWAAIALVAAIFVGAWWYDDGSSPDRSDRYASNCIRDEGYGNWTSSSGLTLEQFCAGVGDYKAILDQRREHPELY